MRTISLWQPWASLWLSPAKLHETRHWATPYRGPLMVHAAKKFVKDVEPELSTILDDEFGWCWDSDLPTGVIIGMVDLVDCVPTDDLYYGRNNLSVDELIDKLCGDHDWGRFAWRRGSYRRFKQPIPYRGHQSFFDVPEAIVKAQMEASELRAA